MGNPRYVYLIGRLRSRQITMEEATELFSLQQQILAGAMAARSPAAPPSGRVPPAPGAPAGPAMAFDDDSLALSLLAMGAGAGILAAIMKRAQEGARKPAD
jgi:hypothetical protein